MGDYVFESNFLIIPGLLAGFAVVKAEGSLISLLKRLWVSVFLLLLGWGDISRTEVAD